MAGATESTPELGQGLVLTLKAPPFPYSWARVMPAVVTVDGRPLPDAQLGRNVVALAPGRHRLHAHIRYWFPRQMGPADYDTDVTAGQWAAVEYRAPLWALAQGAMGPPPQRYNGLVAIVAVLAVSAVFAVLLLVLAL